MMFDSPGGLAHGENSDDKFRYRHKRKKIAKVDQLTAAHYNPRGATPLNDAIIHGIETVAAEGAGDRAFVVILTDGYENASNADDAAVARVIKAYEKKGWAFLYLGANNRDLAQTAAAKGLGAKGQSLAFTSSPSGTRAAFATASRLAGVGYVGEHGEMPDPARYAAASASAFDALGGVIPEDEDEAKRKLWTPKDK